MLILTIVRDINAYMCSPYNQALWKGALPSQHPSWAGAEASTGSRGGSEAHTTSSTLAGDFPLSSIL